MPCLLHKLFKFDMIFDCDSKTGFSAADPADSELMLLLATDKLLA